MAICYYITAREQLAPDAGSLGPEAALRRKVAEAFSAGVDAVQVREKDLPSKRLAALVEDLAALPEKRKARLLVNERMDIAVTCGADGVHLPSDSLPLGTLRRLAENSKSDGSLKPGSPSQMNSMMVGVSCHSEEDVARAAEDKASYVLLAPIFDTPSKPGARPLGLAVLERVCSRFRVPVLALGGVTASNAGECIRAGAVGVAGIRLFQQEPRLKELCRRLQSLNDQDWSFHE